jgi:hypothetical protein
MNGVANPLTIAGAEERLLELNAEEARVERDMALIDIRGCTIREERARLELFLLQQMSIREGGDGSTTK